jgi:two-component system, sporulation sensor kinase E
MLLLKNKSALKVILLIFSIVIASSSLYYTEMLVKKLAKREEKMIDLYAKGLKFIVSPDNNGNISFLFNEIIEANNSIPVILTDDKHHPISSKNIDLPEKISEKQSYKILSKELVDMQAQHEPILVEYPELGIRNYIYYRNSYLLTQLLYYPYLQLAVVSFFGFIAYLAFSYARTAEQNRVWVGLAKETAHQLGTPISSLMAWVEIFKATPAFAEHSIVDELDKDIKRLEIVTSRFSNIGSTPKLKNENIYETIKEGIDYLQLRVSNKIKLSVSTNLNEDFNLPINKPLFGWIIENLVKNAVDAMHNEGKIHVLISQEQVNKIIIEVSDTGKGMTKKQAEQAFVPGFTTKQRGWGLGLTLVKRIVEEYHGGKIKIKTTEVEKGTTFRIEMLSRENIKD